MATASEVGERRLTVTKQKLGHLRVDEQGEVSYKKTPSSTLMASLQLGLQHSIGSLEPKPRRDILMTDFDVIETVDFPSEGSTITQAHKYKDFTFTTYSPVAFRFFREAFQIKAEDYLLALCHQSLRELSNPGASGSLFYLSADDEFIIKTVQKKEAKFLQKLLPGYYLNLTQNKKTLLPKFFGLYQYRCGGTRIRIVVMNNLLPSSLQYHWKFDLKGSSYKRIASAAETKKKSPTYKDLDFPNIHPDGLILSPENYDILTRTLLRDCQVLESFGIMDYSLLLGIFNMDEAIRSGEPPPTPTAETFDSPHLTSSATLETGEKEVEDRSKVFVQSRIEARKNFSIISAETAETDYHEAPPPNYPEGYIQARTEQGDRLLLYLGVIDILQSYRIKKRLEHGFKSIITDGDTVSVHNPTFYSQRFLTFMKSAVFKKERAKIKPRRNSTLVQSKNSKRQTTHQSPGGRLPLHRQDSDINKDSPLHSPKGANPPALDVTPTRRRNLEPIASDTPLVIKHLSVHDEGAESTIELSEVGIVMVDDSGVMNSSTPANSSLEEMTELATSPIVQSSASVKVDATYSNATTTNISNSYTESTQDPSIV